MNLLIHDENPSKRKIAQAVEVLNNDGVIVYPTDTIYAFGCSLYSKKALERICRLKGIDIKKSRFSIICENLSQVSQYTRNLSDEHFKIIKSHTPGPYTFILKGNNQIPKIFLNRRKNIGIRIQQTKLVQLILGDLGHPLLSTSLKNDDEISEYWTDPVEIEEKFGRQVDLYINSGSGGHVPSTVIDLTGDTPVLVREGLGSVDSFDFRD